MGSAAWAPLHGCTPATIPLLIMSADRAVLAPHAAALLARPADLCAARACQSFASSFQPAPRVGRSLRASRSERPDGRRTAAPAQQLQPRAAALPVALHTLLRLFFHLYHGVEEVACSRCNRASSYPKPGARLVRDRRWAAQQRSPSPSVPLVAYSLLRSPPLEPRTLFKEARTRRDAVRVSGPSRGVAEPSGRDYGGTRQRDALCSRAGRLRRRREQLWQGHRHGRRRCRCRAAIPLPPQPPAVGQIGTCRRHAVPIGCPAGPGGQSAGH